MKKYVFRRYSSEYQKFYKLEKMRLRKVLKSAKIEHVGSTALAGLGGKGILDILIGVPKNKIRKIKEKLEDAGYEFRKSAGTPDRLFFRKDYSYKKSKRRVHLHLTAVNSKDWKDLISFRDYLKRHPEAVQQYEHIKKEAVRKAHGEGEIYRKHKQKFIKYILNRSKMPLQKPGTRHIC